MMDAAGIVTRLGVGRWGSPVVQDRAALDAALARNPARIVVEGSESLRAHAAELATRSLVPEMSHGPGAATVPALGRFTDGFRQRRSADRRQRIWRRHAGVTPVLAGLLGVGAALALEWRSFATRVPVALAGRPSSQGAGTLPASPAVFVLAALAIAALAYLMWQAAGGSRPVHTSWRVDKRVQGRLIMARVRTPVA